MKIESLSIAIAVAAVSASGCAHKPAVSTSTLQGTLAKGSFPSAPVEVVAIDERGARVRSAVATDGAFRLELHKGHTYSVSVVLTAGSEPLVFPRAGARLDTTFRIKTGAALVALGAVRHIAAAPAKGFAVLSTPARSLINAPLSTSNAPLSTKVVTAAGPGKCVDGTLAGTSTPCADDNTKASCDDGNDEESDGDGECENGKDAKTGASCSDADERGSDADPTKPMAVADHNVPDEVGGCNDGDDEGDEEDDD